MFKVNACDENSIINQTSLLTKNQFGYRAKLRRYALRFKL